MARKQSQRRHKKDSGILACFLFCFALPILFIYGIARLISEIYNSVSQTRFNSCSIPKVSTKHCRFSISDVDHLTGQEFEFFMANILRYNGFEKVRVTKATRDHGVDILASKDSQTYAIQCKRWSNTLGVLPIQEVFSGKSFYDCDVAVVVTNSQFSKDAIQLAAKIGVRLWDRSVLISMMS